MIWIAQLPATSRQAIQRSLQQSSRDVLNMNFVFCSSSPLIRQAESDFLACYQGRLREAFMV